MRKHSRAMCLLLHRCRRRSLIHPIPLLCLNRVTNPSPTTPSTAPSTPSTLPSRESPVNEEAPNTSARSEREASFATTRSAHRHRGRFTGITWPYYCGSSPCVRIVVAEPPPVYRASVLWWPGYYDYAPGQFGRGHPRYGGYGRPAGYHGD